MRYFLLSIAVFTGFTGFAMAQTPELLPDEHPSIQPEMLTPDSEAVLPPADDVPAQPDDEGAQLDTLFSELKKAANPSYAKTIADRIWSVWFKSGSATTDLMMHWASEAMERRDYNIALDMLDQVITRAPDFAEGWNRRATVHFIMNNDAKSMADIGRVLELEPRHFGALSGLAMILERNGRKEAALDAWQRTLKIYPGMKNAQNAVIRLQDDLAGKRA